MDSPSIDRRIRDAAARSYDVITWPELRALGVSEDVLPRLVRDGVIRRIHRGVYTTARVLPQLSLFLAATCATGAVLSHRSAARVLGLLRIDYGPVHVTRLEQAANSRKGIKVHKSPLRPFEITEIDGILITTVARTIIDVAETESDHRLHKAIDAAFDLRLYDHRDMLRTLDAHPNRHGTRLARSALATHEQGTHRGESPSEDLLQPLLTTYGLPLPRTQVHITLPDGTPIRPDAVYIQQKVVIELDDDSHFNPRRAHHDRRRDALLTATGYRVLRFAYSQLIHEPALVAAAIRTQLTHDA